VAGGIRSGVVSRVIALAVAASLAVAALAAARASAETYRVSRHDDPRPGACKPGDCSLREAIRTANGHPGRDVVVLPDRRPRYVLSRRNAGGGGEDWNARGDLDVIDPIAIRHGRQGRAIVDARGIDRVLEVHAHAATKLARVGLSGGAGAVAGGGVAARAPLSLVRSAVLGNRAGSGGGIFAAERLTLRRTRVRANAATAGAGGGVAAGGGRVRVIRSRLAGNRAAGAGGGLAATAGALRLGGSTVAGNLAAARGGGVALLAARARVAKSTVSGNVSRRAGGGIHQSASSLGVVNSTITGNRAGLTGGGVRSAGGVVILNSVTVARNVAGFSGPRALGGGVAARGGVGVANSIIALNRSAARPDDCHGAFASLGGNLVGTVAGCRGFVGSALIGAAPRLGPLRDNGGPTETLALRPGSAAIDGANEARAPTADQRGRRRPAHPDIGAFERLP
jgi:CSLREA domain-containing protein